MGQICNKEKNSESRKILNSFKTINPENNLNFNINCYDENCQKVLSFSKNNFEKLGQMQQLRVDFIQEVREEINNLKNYNYNSYNNYNNNYINYPQNQYPYAYHNNLYTLNNLNYYNISDTEQILYYIIIMTLTLKSYLKRNYISNELEKSLLELSVIILKKIYNNKDLKLILYYLSKMFEILFKNISNIQFYININDYLSKINIVANDYNILTKEEKYPFFLTHIISLGEYFHNDYNNILINSLNQSSLMRYYIYLIFKNYDFIIDNYSTYKNIILKKNNLNNNNNYYNLANSQYNKNDLIEEDKFSENIIRKAKEYDDLNKISISINYFLIVCSQDTFTGKNIFHEFDNQFELGIKDNKLDNDINLIKFKETCFIILFNNLNPDEHNSTIFLSFFEYLCDNKKSGIFNNDIYYEKFIELYGKYNNNKIFIDKYSLILNRIFIIEIESYKKDNFIIDKLYNYIHKVYNKNSGMQKNNEIKMNYENLFFFVNLIKYISSYYKKNKNIKTAYDILIYLASFIKKIKHFYKKPENSIIDNNIDLQIYQNFNISLNNFDYNKNDFFTTLYENIHIPLSNFISEYIILFNEFFKIKKDNIMNNKFHCCIINTITYLEISMITKNRRKNIQIIIKLLSIYVNCLNTIELIDYEEIDNYLIDNLRLIINEIKIGNNNYGIFSQSLQFTTYHLIIIYNAILIILLEINKKKSNLSDLISKHNKILKIINGYNHFIGSHFYPKNENIQQYNVRKLYNLLSNGEVYNIQKESFLQIIYIFQRILFNDEDEDSHASFSRYRTRTIYQKDKKNEINISINTNNYFDGRKFIFLDNNLNDSFSQISNKYLNYNGSQLNISHHQNNSNVELFSEKLKLPFKDNNNSINFSEQNNTLDIISDKGSLNCNFKV